jgi:hypothetical protein
MRPAIAIGTAVVMGLASAAHADVTVTSTVGGKVMGRDMSGQSVHYIKGTKMRMETQNGVSILDAGTRQMIVLNDKKKEAEVFDMAKLGAEIQKNIGAVEPKVSFTPTGQKKDLLGRSCDGYMLTVTIPVTMGNDTLNLTMTGPAWIAKGAPGTKDYIAFYLEAAKNGMFFGSPQQAKAQGGQMKSTTEMYKAFAGAGGIAYQNEMEMKFEGTGMMASMMNKMGGMTTTSTVTAVSTDPIPDDKFTVPAGYKTVNK